MRALVLLAVAAVTRAAAAEPEAPPPDAVPATSDARAAIQRLLEREVPPLAVQPFRTPRGVQGSAEAAAPPQVQGGDPADEVAIPLGTAMPVTCAIFAERLDAAAATWRTIEAAKRSVKILGARPVEVLAVAGSALLFTEVTYQVDTEKGPMLGQLKLAVYADDARSLLCHHDEPGYGDTFERVVKGLAASLQGGGTDERAGARFAEIFVMRLGGIPVGYTERVIRDGGGGRVSTTYASQLLPRSPTDLLANDTWTEEVLDAKDLLASGTFVHMSNGELDTKIHLTRRDDRRTFRYEGEKGGKPLAGSFRTKAGLSTDLWFARRLAATAPAPKGPLRHEAYSFEANPVAALPVVYRADRAAPRRASMEMGPIRITGDLDEHGLFTMGELPVGPTKLVVERVWSRGSP